MRDTDRYRHRLGLESPWTVSRVELWVAEGKVEVWADHPKRTRWHCPDCDRELSCHDHSEQRTWRHLDSCQFLTYLHARPPRVEGPEHGVRQVRLPWAEPMARFTILFERLAIDVLAECDIDGAAHLLRLSWDEAWHLMERAVARGKAAKARRVPELIGVDEKAAAKGDNYLTLVCELGRGTVEYIADERKQASLDGYLDSFSPDEQAQITAVATDMWQPYLNSIKTHVTDADKKIVFDRFPIMKHMGTAVDTVRKSEHKALRAQGLEILTDSKYPWLYSEQNLPDRHRQRFASLKQENLKTTRAWACHPRRGLPNIDHAGSGMEGTMPPSRQLRRR